MENFVKLFEFVIKLNLLKIIDHVRSRYPYMPSFSIINMSSLLDDVNELLRQNQGDLARLQNIKKTLEANKILYVADRQYMTTLTKKLIKKLTKDNTINVHSTEHVRNSESIQELERKIRVDRTEE